ncbi:MAG TPA: efflux RND transporter periplasmic adaptor subunit [Cyclobacteriaceae bacterium]|jgi:membrane fusion protein (multidrug efflux system)|nr:efflux RND transporter periplasmic adaptor subunit [Cyclobacteriaceae bacterium]
MRILVLLAIAIAVTACQSKKQNDGRQRIQGPMMVDGFVVESHTISDNVEVPGSLLPFEETSIRPEVSGRVVALNIPEGAIVPKGTILVKLFDQDLRAQLRKLEVQLQIAKKNEERQSELLKISGISQSDYDLSALSVENLKADIETTRIALSKMEIRTPYEGRVGLRNVSLGAYISPTDIITVLRQDKQLKLEFSVPEKYAKNISKGYKVQFKVDGGAAYHNATVIATESSVEQTTRTLKVRAVVNEIHAELVPGIFAKVNLQLGKNDHAMLVPTQSILTQARNKQVVICKNGMAKFSVVETGVRDSSYVEIVTGVHVGDTVVTTGLMGLRPDARLKVTKVNEYK